MANRLGYHHVAFRAQDFEASVKFYEALGCKMIRTWGEAPNLSCMLDVGGGNILEMFAGGKDEAEVCPRFEHIALKSDDPDDDFNTALANGAAPHVEPKDVNIGGNYPVRIAFVKGLSGEIIEFFKEY